MKWAWPQEEANQQRRTFEPGDLTPTPIPCPDGILAALLRNVAPERIWILLFILFD